MYGKINYTLVGVFVTSFIIAIVLFGFWLFRYGFERDYDYYYIYFQESVNGLSVDSTVKLKGVEVGKVSSIAIDDKNVEQVKVLVKLNSGTPITKDMHAVLNLQGITGLSYVEIRGGKYRAERLKSSKDAPAVIPSEPSIATKFMDEAPQIVDRLVKALDSFNRVLSKQNIDNLSSIITTTKDVSKKAIELESSYISLAKELNSTVLILKEDINRTIKNLNSITGKVDYRLISMIDKVEDTTVAIGKFSKTLNRKLKRGEYDLRKMVRPIEVDIKELSYQYQELANSLKSLTNTPSSLIFGSGKVKRGPGE